MPSTTSENTTPLMKQYYELKEQAGGAILFFRMGDFYEMFGDDAVEASRVLEITLTTRDRNKPNPIPMAGVPHHSAQNYIQRLLDSGRKVAIGEQVEDPATAKGIVRREIVRTFTPAVQFDGEGTEPAYLATAVSVGQRSGGRWVLACLDPARGEALVSEALTEEALDAELAQLPVRHFLDFAERTPEEIKKSLRHDHAFILIETLPPNYLTAEKAKALLCAHYGTSNLDAALGAQAPEAAATALGLLVQYSARSQQQEKLEHLRFPLPLRQPKTLKLGPRSAAHLDLVPGNDGSPNLYTLINRTRSALGARELRRWLLEPLREPAEIAHRQEGVRELSAHPALIERLSKELAELYDLERILGRVNTRLASPRDTLALGRSLAALSKLAHALETPDTLNPGNPVRSEALSDSRDRLREAADALGPLSERILRTQREDAPLLARDGGIFEKGTDPELDRLIELSENGQQWLVELETRERETTGIPTLKVRYNRVFGYYIEVTKAHQKSVPAHYQRKQTMVGAERYFTEELKKFEEEFVTASARQKALEMKLFDELLAQVQALTAPVMETARLLGELDALTALSKLAREPGWTFPEINDSFELEIKAGRHPLVDATASGEFVPNDLSLSPETRMSLLITGPNMGGKSTIMRQVALIVILGQIGGPVPAESARWGSFASIHTRIGAHDAIARGQSTFMVEMSELAHILHHADERSLIILDEIGRGTSTYDGISVAWSTLEHLCRKVRARTLFATHYHELTRLADQLPLLANAHMGVDGSRDGKLRFLYQLKDDPANESFGVHVARLAGLPPSVVERAWEVLEDLESSASLAAAGASDANQLSLFDAPGGREARRSQAHSGNEALARAGDPASERQNAADGGDSPLLRFEEHPVVKELDGTDLNSMTPLQALNLLARLQESARKSPEASA